MPGDRVEKPGLKGSLRTVVTGIHYQVPGLREATLDGEIVELHVHIKGKRVIRKALVGEIEGQRQPQDPKYPRNMIGMIAVNADQPQNRLIHDLPEADQPIRMDRNAGVAFDVENPLQLGGGYFRAQIKFTR